MVAMAATFILATAVSAEKFGLGLEQDQICRQISTGYKVMVFSRETAAEFSKASLNPNHGWKDCTTTTILNVQDYLHVFPLPAPAQTLVNFTTSFQIDVQCNKDYIFVWYLSDHVPPQMLSVRAFYRDPLLIERIKPAFKSVVLAHEINLAQGTCTDFDFKKHIRTFTASKYFCYFGGEYYPEGLMKVDTERCFEQRCQNAQMIAAKQVYQCCPDGCPENSICGRNGFGICECATGYVEKTSESQNMKDMATQCVDKDECLDVQRCPGALSTCTNTNGSYTCKERPRQEQMCRVEKNGLTYGVYVLSNFLKDGEFHAFKLRGASDFENCSLGPVSNVADFVNRRRPSKPGSFGNLLSVHLECNRDYMFVWYMISLSPVKPIHVRVSLQNDQQYDVKITLPGLLMLPARDCTDFMPQLFENTRQEDDDEEDVSLPTSQAPTSTSSCVNGICVCDEGFDKHVLPGIGITCFRILPRPSTLAATTSTAIAASSAVSFTSTTQESSASTTSQYNSPIKAQQQKVIIPGRRRQHNTPAPVFDKQNTQKTQEEQDNNTNKDSGDKDKLPRAAVFAIGGGVCILVVVSIILTVAYCKKKNRQRGGGGNGYILGESTEML